MHVVLDTRAAVATVTLNRPEVHNALNPELIRELSQAFAQVGADPSVRVVVLTAVGESFCAGADLRWMREAADYPFERNLEEAEQLAGMFRAIYDCPKPVIGRVQGSAFGGGVGLVAVCDMTVAAESARFCFSEAKLGLIPAVISPFVLRRMIPSIARRYFLTAERFSAQTARSIGLLSEVAADEGALDTQVGAWTKLLVGNGPEALAACKRLAEEMAGLDLDDSLPLAARRIAEARAGEEGREGIRAFLEKRPPAWSCLPEDVGAP
jgi:methylglutaconyl-CoA hydratase